MDRPGYSGVPAQAQLFAQHQDPPMPGFRYERNFLSAAEERSLLEAIDGLELKEAQYRQWRAHRRTLSFGGKYDFTHQRLLPAEAMPAFLFELRARIAAWSGIEAAQFNHGLIAEYRAGTQLGWHRDVPNFEAVVGVSLAGAARMRFRPYPPPAAGERKTAFALDLEPRSIYTLQAAARWQWQHAISATKSLRYSITFRTLTAPNSRSPLA